MNNKEPKIDFNEPREFIQLYDGMAQKLRNGKEAYEYPSTCYILRNEKHDPMVYRVISKRLSSDEPQYCQVVDEKEVWAIFEENASICPPDMDGTCVGIGGIWRRDPILDRVVNQSGFDTDVDAWLDNWSKSVTDFESGKRYAFWLVKLIYPHTNLPIRILNKANDPIQ